MLTALAILEELRRKHSDELKTTVRNPPYMVSAISLFEFNNYSQFVSICLKAVAQSSEERFKLHN